MFTGIVEEVGLVKQISQKSQSMQITVHAQRIMADMALGDSIAINGVCLTVTSFSATSFTMDVMPETFRKTTLRQLSHGSQVNLERAMSAKGRFGGHIVQGHVDGKGIIVARQNEENAIKFTIEPSDSSLLRYMIDHGSITLDGISLTIVSVMERSFIVSIIPHTLKETVFNHRQVGDYVNIECDVLGKYVERLLFYKSNDDGKSKANEGGSLTEDFLIKNGFM